MKTITDPSTCTGIMMRLAAVTTESPRQWGTMSPAEMLLHCRKQIGLGTGEVPAKAMFPSPIQWLAKQTFGFTLPWKRNLPTAPEMVARGQDGLDVGQERDALVQVIQDFNRLPDDAVLSGHPIFGRMTKAEWGCIIQKHLDHHLRQFGC